MLVFFIAVCKTEVSLLLTYKRDNVDEREIYQFMQMFINPFCEPSQRALNIMVTTGLTGYKWNETIILYFAPYRKCFFTEQEN